LQKRVNIAERVDHAEESTLQKKVNIAKERAFALQKSVYIAEERLYYRRLNIAGER
jgi:hypothetical protein